MSYIPEYHENYYRVEGTAFNQGKIGIGTINPVQLLHVSGGNIRLDGTGFFNGDLNVTGNLNVYGSTAQFAVSQVIAEDKSIELNAATGSPIGGGSYTTSAFTDDAGADEGGLVLKSTQGDKVILYETVTPASGWVSNLRWVVSGNYGKNTLQLSDVTANVGMTIGTDANSVNLYRSANDTLKTDDNLIVGINGGKTTLQLSDTTANVGLTIGGDTNLYRSAADILKTDDSFIVDGAAFTVNSATITLGDANTDTVTINAGTISLVNATAAGDALEFGAGANLANLYRSANDTLRTDDSLIVNINLTANGNATLGDATTDTHIVNGTLTNNLPDNTATVVDLKESTNSYIKLDTTNASELVTIGATPKFTSLNTTDATNSTTAAATFVGGVGIAKKLYVGTDLNVIGYSIASVNATVTAGTDAQGQGTLTKYINIITTNASNPGAVTLPTAQAGMRIMIRNTTANGLKIYPATSAQIDALGANTAFGTTLTTNTQRQFYAISATQWYSV